MTHAHAKGQGERSVGSKDGAETDGRTETIALASVLRRSVKCASYSMLLLCSSTVLYKKA